MRQLVTICLLGAASVLQVGPAKPQAVGLTAAEISGRMSKVYSGCSSYEDAGHVHKVIIGEGGRETVEDLSFTTAFVRPDRFRYQFTTKNVVGQLSQYVIWRQGAEVKTWWNMHSPNLQTDQSLVAAIVAAMGVSDGTTHMIPRLLLPDEIAGPSLDDLWNVSRLPDAEQDAAPCFVLEGKVVLSDKRTVTKKLWIDRASFLVRRVDTECVGTQLSSTESTTYIPVAGAAVAEEKLAFSPPEK